MIWKLNKILVNNVLNKQYFSLLKSNQTHYEVLNLPINCSFKDIKTSYIKLSKQFHPDTNVNKDAHEKFIKIVTAYKILSKPESRRNYDLGLVPIQDNGKRERTGIRTTASPWDDAYMWNNRNKQEDKYYKSQPYYGIKGIGKVSNFYIAMICCLITAFAVCVQMLAIRNSFTLNRSEMLEKSRIAEKALQEMKENAMKNGKLKQIELLQERLKVNENKTKTDD